MNKDLSVILTLSVNKQSITERYLKGDFVGLKLDDLKISKKRINCYIRDGDDYTDKIAFVPNDGYKNCTYYLSKKKVSTCNYCKRAIVGDPIGYPISFRTKKIIENGHYKIIKIFDVKTANCTFECAYAMCDFLEKNSPYKSEYIRYLKFLFNIKYPGKVLRKRNDIILLEENGGSIPEDKFFSKEHKYIKTDELFLLPAASIYTCVRNK